jgi:hypothetical protein
MEWLLTERLEVANDALPALSAALPIAVVPSRNVTVPVAVEGETAAVNVTPWPEVAGLTLDVTAVVVVVLPLPPPAAIVTALDALTRPQPNVESQPAGPKSLADCSRMFVT